MITEAQTAPDWKAIALALAQRVNFAITQLEVKGGGYLMDAESWELTTWRDYMADGMEMIPGVKVDREIMHTMSLPKSKRKNAQEKIKAEHAAKATGETK